MRLNVSGSKNSKSFYIIKSVIVDGKNTSKVVEKLGNLETVTKLAYPEDPYVWARNRAKELTELENSDKEQVIVKYSSSKKISPNLVNEFNGGYLFLQKIYHELGLDRICQSITDKYRFTYDLDSILSRLVYSRILFPCSKKATFSLVERFIEQPNFELHQMYRSLEVLTKEMDFIQSELYKNSLSIVSRNSKVLYYDCTNYFFEIEDEDGNRMYAQSKENRPSPVVQMGLFMDGNGLPLAFSMTPGNQNEQTTLKPLEKQIINDFGINKMVVCTDAGLSSVANRKFNNSNNRRFITTQSLKKLKAYLKPWALAEDGWTLPNGNKVYSLSEINELDNSELIFYKQRWINDDGLSQRIIVSYSTKYKKYQEHIREKQINRALKLIEKGVEPGKKINQHDVKRFIKKTTFTEDGEIAENYNLSLNEDVIAKEAMYDGFYGVCTNLEEDISDILKINRGRWEIEESFRIMKSEFKSRPVNLSKQERIDAHFLTCFIGLLIFRILEKRIDEKYTCPEILKTLRNMNFSRIQGEGIVPVYTRTDITDKLHDSFGFETDFEIVTNKKLKKILKYTKS